MRNAVAYFRHYQEVHMDAANNNPPDGRRQSIRMMTREELVAERDACAARAEECTARLAELDAQPAAAAAAAAAPAASIG
eukprot:gene18101-32963_t